MTTTKGPTVRRKRLRAELRRERELANLTQEQVASTMDWSLSKIIRIESGTVGVSTNDLKALLELYGVTDAERVRSLVTLAQSARQRMWWSGYRGIISNQQLTYIGYEAEAAAMSHFHAAVVPGLFQTEGYMRAIMNDSPLEPLDPDTVETLIKVRLSRQRHVLDRPDPPDLAVILDEAVLRRTVGGPTVMRDQLRHLQQLARQPNVVLQVVPFAAGAHPGVNGPFAILEFGDPADDDIVYLAGGPSEVILREDQDEIAAYRHAFKRLENIAYPAAESLDVISRVSNELG
jgi:transcriptional regulator with XRE-family HTH domain